MGDEPIKYRDIHYTSNSWEGEAFEGQSEGFEVERRS